MLEESGFHIKALSPVGFIHLHHLTTKPAGYPSDFLYPDFVSVVFMLLRQGRLTKLQRWPTTTRRRQRSEPSPKLRPFGFRTTCCVSWTVPYESARREAAPSRITRSR